MLVARGIRICTVAAHVCAHTAREELQEPLLEQAVQEVLADPDGLATRVALFKGFCRLLCGAFLRSAALYALDENELAKQREKAGGSNRRGCFCMDMGADIAAFDASVSPAAAIASLPHTFINHTVGLIKAAGTAWPGMVGCAAADAALGSFEDLGECLMVGLAAHVSLHDLDVRFEVGQPAS